MFATVATHAARNSRFTAGKVSILGFIVPEVVVGTLCFIAGLVVVGFWLTGFCFGCDAHDARNKPDMMRAVCFILWMFMEAKIFELNFR